MSVHPMLAACVAARPDGAAMRECVAAGVRRDELVREARRHAMGPLLYAVLREHCGSDVPADVLEELRAESQGCAHQSLRLTGELLRLMEVFGERGVEALPFKGPVLAWPLYGSPALRYMGDLDVLVRPEELERAQAVLGELGYEPWTKAEPTRFLSANPEIAYVRDGVVVDLHWGLAPAWFSGWFDVDAVMRRAECVEVAGRRTRTMCGADLLRYLCMHAAKHGWFRLRDACDIARLIASGADVSAAVEDARRWGGLRTLLAGLALAGKDCGGAEELTSAAKAHLSGEAADFGSTVAGLRWQWGLLERTSERVALCRSLLRPNALDWEWIPLDRRFYAAYYAVKPVRLLGKYLGMAFGR